MSKYKYNGSHPETESSVTNLVIGATAGCLLGASTALLLNPKKEGFQDQIKDKYNELSEQAQDYAHDIMEKGQDVYEKAVDYVEDIKETATEFIDKSLKSIPAKPLIIGAIGGGLLATAAVLYFKSSGIEEEGEKVRRIATGLKGQKKSGNWVQAAKEIATALNNQFNPEEGIELEESSKQEGNPIKDAVQLTLLGLNLWNNIKKRR